MTTDFTTPGFEPPRSFDIDRAVADIKTELLGLFGTEIHTSRGVDLFPAFPESYSQLHDYIDANTLGGFYGPNVDDFGPDAADRSNWSTETFAEVQDIIHEWLVKRFEQNEEDYRLIRKYNDDDEFIASEETS